VKLLITGICGFVGSSLARSLLARFPGWKVWGMDNLARAGSEVNRPLLRALGVHVIHGARVAPAISIRFRASIGSLMLPQTLVCSPVSMEEPAAGN
jgi:nucleoside-diphosphate-sugar epimerase